MKRLRHSAEAQLDTLQEQSLRYFWNESDPFTGLMAERSEPDSPASIEATGYALTSYPIATERRYISRREAVEKTLSTLRFISCTRNGAEPEATCYNGFFYRLLDMKKGRRAKRSELSVTGTAILIAGALTAAEYFDQNTPEENEIRQLAEELYSKVNWKWAVGKGKKLSRGWRPESGFIPESYSGYDEAFLAYILALGSPTFPLSEEDYNEWKSSYRWIHSYGYDFLYAGPLYIHQLPHVWLDLRNITDKEMISGNSDYFENSSKATRVQQLYSIDNPGRFEGYGKKFWGISLSEGPGKTEIKVNKEIRQFLGYAVRGVPEGPDDGTISPWVSIASLPFAPDIVLSTIEHFFNQPDLTLPDSYGFRSAYNPSFPHKTHNPHGWRSSWHYASNQGPAVALIENYRSGLLWNLSRKNKHFRKGLESAGFKGGWIVDTIKEIHELQESV